MNNEPAITDRRRTAIFAVLLAACIAGAFAQTSLTTALPAIMGDLGISAVLGNWLTSGFSLAMGVTIPATAFMMKRFPTRPLFLTGLALFAAGLLFAAASRTFPLLMAARVVQALGSGISLSMTQVIILALFAKSGVGTAMGFYGLAVSAAPVIAPTISGVMVDRWGWQSIFWVSGGISAAVLLLAFPIMRNVLETSASTRLDVPSFLLSAFGFVGLQLGFSDLGVRPFLSLGVAGALAVGLICLALFAVRQFRIDKPFLELRIFATRDFTVAVVLSMVLYAVLIAASTILPIYLQRMAGASVTVSALVMMPGSLVMALASPVTGRVFDRFGIRPLAIGGMAILLATTLAFGFLTASTPIWYVTAVFAVRSVGVSMVMMPAATWGLASVERRYASDASALLTSLRTIAGALGSAVFVAVMVACGDDPAGVSIAFLAMAGVAAAGLAMTVVCCRKRAA
ncbi:DHA2 family efflux MFS transporter permease subunit [Bifidobacterium avesanii]|uniref:DHA2 family efflux MFS transporter permease subunit n=1 Tax=Bifidobacterium avesanii TaxID=1798157 RepID=A0A7K3TF80_9BIFI|nr:DHA2 family efflux MFS transporter permease subunit [Bifidobacterium avesanii]KAB8295667.1 MFS family major facilitator transporter, multidrug:cation symporter [Bifidobacterium avesanii]NEG77672.1 DHA2 family efflux MFS transporter permease subunit [Bifidobacterium avesanii]